MNETGAHQSAAPRAEAWAVYLLECVDGRVYTGIARDPEQRYAQHSAGKGARFTRANPPRALLGWVWVNSRRAALKLEIAWKRLPRAERIAALRAIPKTGQSQKRVTTRLLASGVANPETDCAPIPVRPPLIP